MSQIELQIEFRRRLAALGVAWAENVLVHSDDLGNSTGSVSIPTERGTYTLSVSELEFLIRNHTDARELDAAMQKVTELRGGKGS